MGSANEVATQTARILLLDDDFHRLLDMIKAGRLAFRNIRKVIIYLFPGGCFAQIVSMILSVYLGCTSDFSSFGMFMVSFVIDVGPSISMIMEKEEEDLMLLPPRSIDDRLVDWKLLVQGYIIIGGCMAATTQLFFLLYMSSYANIGFSDIVFTFGTPTVNNTAIMQNTLSNDAHVNIGSSIVFICVVFVNILGNLMVHKTAKRSFVQQSPMNKRTRNVWVYVAAVYSVVLALVVQNIPYFQNKFGMAQIPVMFYILIIAVGLLLFGIEELRKFLVRRKIAYLDRFAW